MAVRILTNEEIDSLQESNASPSLALPASHQLRSMHVLLAEDNLVNQMVAVRILEKSGHTVDTVDNGQAALEAMARRTYDVVLMDVQMPAMDGLETSATIRRREHATGSRRTPIIAMTANAMKGDRERCLAAGMDDYIAKPIRARDLLEKLRRSEAISAPDRDGSCSARK
jgi:CheY-like chemotaxis protein